MPIPKKAMPINYFTISGEVYNKILNWITEGDLHPGEKLLDKDSESALKLIKLNWDNSMERIRARYDL